MRQIRIEKTSVERTPELAAYLASINNFPALTVEQEIDLTIAAQAGNKQAKDMLVNCNLRFVVSIAKQYNYCRGTLSIMDLINEGNMGLIEAVDTFDVTQGFKFISYAVAFIRKYILQALSKKSRIVTNYQEKDAPNTHTSLDEPCYDDNDTTLADVYCQHTDKESNTSLSSDLLRIMHTLLNDKELYIVCHIYGINAMPESKFIIAERLRLTEERIRQIAEYAIHKLKTNEKAIRLLLKYL